MNSRFRCLLPAVFAPISRGVPPQVGSYRIIDNLLMINQAKYRKIPGQDSRYAVVLWRPRSATLLEDSTPKSRNSSTCCKGFSWRTVLMRSSGNSPGSLYWWYFLQCSNTRSAIQRKLIVSRTSGLGCTPWPRSGGSHCLKFDCRLQGIPPQRQTLASR